MQAGIVPVGPDRAHWRPRPGGGMRTSRSRQCARPSRNDLSSAHGTQPRRARGLGEVPGGRRPPRRSSDSRVRASRMCPAQNPRSRGDVRRRFCTRATKEGDPVARVRGKWLRLCKTLAGSKNFQTCSAHVQQAFRAAVARVRKTRPPAASTAGDDAEKVMGPRPRYPTAEFANHAHRALPLGTNLKLHERPEPVHIKEATVVRERRLTALTRV